MPPEVLLKIDSLEVRTYGVMIAIAILFGFLWAEARAKRWAVNPKLLSDFLFWAVIGAILGARVGFILQNLSFFAQNPSQLISLQLAGLSFHGALVGGLAGGLILLISRQRILYFWQLADMAAAPLLLGPAIGRIGNWANQELYGYPTSVPWAIPIDPAHRLPGYEQFATFHPTFAYEALLNLIGLIILVRFLEASWFQKTRPAPQNYELRIMNQGKSFLFALGWYSVARFITEIWRISDRIVGPLSLAQIISIALLLLLVWLYRRRQDGARTPTTL